jgi:TolB protein
LTSGPYWNDYPRLSPDAGRIAFTSNRSGKQEMWLMNSDGSDPRSLTPQLPAAHSPAWSPDGQSLAFISNQYAQDDLFTLHLASGEIKRLTSHDGYDGYPDWSPDGKKIAYASQRGDNQDIYLIDVETLAEERITSHPAPDTAPAFSPDGQHLAFVSERPDAKEGRRFMKSLWDFFYGDDDLDIWLIELGSGKLRQLTTNRGADRHVRWSPDGRYVVFTNSSAQDVATRLMLCEIETGIISPFEVDRDMLNMELRGSQEIRVLTKSDPLLDKITPEALDEIYRKIGQQALDRTYYATERYIDWR